MSGQWSGASLQGEVTSVRTLSLEQALPRSASAKKKLHPIRLILKWLNMLPNLSELQKAMGSNGCSIGVIDEDVVYPWLQMLN